MCRIAIIKKQRALSHFLSCLKNQALENELFEEDHKRRNPAVSEAERLMENNSSACEERDRLRDRERGERERERGRGRGTGAADGRGD